MDTCSSAEGACGGFDDHSLVSLEVWRDEVAVVSGSIRGSGFLGGDKGGVWEVFG